MSVDPTYNTRSADFFSRKFHDHLTDISTLTATFTNATFQNVYILTMIMVIKMPR